MEGSTENLTSQQYSNYYFFLLVEHDWSSCVSLADVFFSMKLYTQSSEGWRKRTRDLSFLSPSHGPLRFVTSLSRPLRFALASIRNTECLRRRQLLFNKLIN